MSISPPPLRYSATPPTTHQVLSTADMKLAYLFNWYPQPSTTALRREVAAFEKMGIPIHRFTLRRYDGGLG